VAAKSWENSYGEVLEGQVAGVSNFASVHNGDGNLQSVRARQLSAITCRGAPSWCRRAMLRVAADGGRPDGFASCR
jgi:hypothetical protein